RRVSPLTSMAVLRYGPDRLRWRARSFRPCGRSSTGAAEPRRLSLWTRSGEHAHGPVVSTNHIPSGPGVRPPRRLSWVEADETSTHAHSVATPSYRIATRELPANHHGRSSKESPDADGCSS